MPDFHHAEAGVAAAARNSPHSRVPRPPRGYSLTVHGISKKYTSPEDLQQRAEGILRERFRVFPEVEEFVQEVIYLLDTEGDMAVLFFDSELLAELLLEVCCDEATSPLSIAGKRFTLKRGYRESKQFLRFADNQLLKSPEKVLYLGGVPEKWEDRGRVEAHFNGVLENDFPSKVVTTVHILPAAAYVQFTSKSAIDRLFYHCERDARLVTGIGRSVVLCYGVKFVPFLRSEGEPGQVNAGVSDGSSANYQDASRMVLPEQEQSSRAGHSRMPDVQVEAQLHVEKLRNGPADETFQPSPEDLGTTTQGALHTVAVSSVSHQMEQPFRRNSGSLQARGINQPTEDASRREANRNQINVQAARRAFCPTEFIDVQQCVMVGGFSRSDVSLQRLTTFLQSMICKHGLNSSEAGYQVRMEWDHARDAALVMLASEELADRLMSVYVRSTQDFSLDGLKVWLCRPEGYRRRQAIYSEGPPSGATKVIMLNMSRVTADEEQQFKEALLEAVETTVLRSGVLERNKSPLKDVFHRGSTTYAVVQASVARALLQYKPLFVSGRPLDIRESPAQTVLHIVNLPPETSKYDPHRLKQILRDAIRKMQPSLSLVDSITSVNWLPAETRAQVYLQSEAVADAIMAAYVRHTGDFCLQDLPLTIFRHNCYVRPGAVFRNRSSQSSPRNREVFLGEVPSWLDPVPLGGAIAELVHRELAGEGVLERCERVIRRCFWKKGDRGAKLTVDEMIAEKLLALGEVRLAGVPMTFSLPGSPGIPQVARTGGTGGWIEEDEA